MKQPLQYLTDEHGTRTAVVVPMAAYEKLLQDLEELADLAVVAPRQDEPTISHEDFLAELKREELL